MEGRWVGGLLVARLLAGLAGWLAKAAVSPVTDDSRF